MKKYVIFLLVILIGFSACNQKSLVKQPNPKLIEKPHLKLTSDLMTPEVLWSFGRLSDPQLSPDGKTLVYGVTYYSKVQNKGNRELYRIGVDGKNLKQLTHTAGSEYNAVWRPDGKKIGFLSPRSGSMQIWEMNPDGSEKRFFLLPRLNWTKHPTKSIPTCPKPPVAFTPTCYTGIGING